MNATGRTMLWALIDLLGTSLGVALMAVNPIHAKVDGVKPNALFLITATWRIEDDTDVDLWTAGPSRRPVFYGSRQNGCADLDRDDLGDSTSRITLADGSQVYPKQHTETTSLRCIEPGQWDVAVNLYSYHGRSASPTPVHVEVTQLNPSVRTAWAGDVTLDRLGQTINAVSFDLDKDGELRLVDPPLDPLTHLWTKPKSPDAMNMGTPP